MNLNPRTEDHKKIAGYEPIYDGLMTVHTCAHTQDLSYMSSAFNTEVDNATGQPADFFEPAPENVIQIATSSQETMETKLQKRIRSTYQENGHIHQGRTRTR